MSNVDAFSPPLHHVDQEHAEDTPIVGHGLDERFQSGVYLKPDPVTALRFSTIGCVVVDEVWSVVVSIDGEQPRGGEPVAYPGAVEASLHHVDEHAGDVSPVVGVVFDELG